MSKPEVDRTGPASTVFVCRECDGHGPLGRFLRRNTNATVRPVGCQDVCQEPVCGLRIGGSLEWFGGMDKPKRQKALAKLVTDARRTRLPDRLVRARVPKRSGKPAR